MDGRGPNFFVISFACIVLLVVWAINLVTSMFGLDLFDWFESFSRAEYEELQRRISDENEQNLRSQGIMFEGEIFSRAIENFRRKKKLKRQKCDWLKEGF